MSERIDYDAVAMAYDSQPYRSKVVDPQLLDFVQSRRGQKLRILDIACGTGNQLIANRAQFPHMEMTGCDLSPGMLEVARTKSAEVRWVEASLVELPFASQSYDYITCQFAFHHVKDQPQGLREIARVISPEGRFVMENISPHHMRESLLYQTFPEALAQDLEDFMAPEEITIQLERIGFKRVSLQLKQLDSEVRLGDFFASVQDKQSNSELALLSAEEYARGLEKLQRQIDRLGAHHREKDLAVLVTIIADRAP